MLLMLEDELECLARFDTVLRGIAPDLPSRVWRNAHTMIREANPLLESARLICLDHDLIPETDGDDPGDGYLVTHWLVEQPTVVPVVVHTSNRERSD